MNNMGLYYPTMHTVSLFGTKNASTFALNPSTLTASAANNLKIIETSGMSECVIDVKYTTGATETNNIINIFVEGSSDRTNWYMLTNESSSSGTSSLYQRTFQFTGAASATAYTFSYRLDISYNYLRVSATESGVVTNYGTVYAEATLAGK